jgi:6-phosphogluconate dehydrogenase
MDIGIVGLGKMGLNMAIRLLRGGHRVVVQNRSQAPADTAIGEGAEQADEIPGFLSALEAPRVVWVMLPAGEVNDRHIREVLSVLEPGDVLVDGANARYTDTLAKAKEAHEAGVHYVDAGVSGGVWGLEGGYSMMVGGEEEAVALVRPALETLAPSPESGWGHVGPVGAGHFVKMVHNGIEYGMMQAYAEGFALLDAKREFGGTEHQLDLPQIAEIWREGSVVRSWLLDLAAAALHERPRLDGVAPFVPDSGEGRWTVEEAVALRVPLTVIAASLFARFDSRDEHGLASRMLSALRGSFGGHPVKGLPGTDGLADDGTVSIIPGGLDTEGAHTR